MPVTARINAPTAANVYHKAGFVWAAVLELEDEGIAELDGFAGAALFDGFKAGSGSGAGSGAESFESR